MRSASRCPPAGRKPCAPLRAVLYHHITERVWSLVDRLEVSTTPAVFEAQVRKMARDYEVVSLDAVLSGGLPRRALLITFDDGYRLRRSHCRSCGGWASSVFFVTGECLERDSLPLDNVLS